MCTAMQLMHAEADKTKRKLINDGILVARNAGRPAKSFFPLVTEILLEHVEKEPGLKSLIPRRTFMRYQIENEVLNTPDG
jgi:hypothetical protein